MKNIKLDPRVRTEQLLTACLELSKEAGYRCITREAIAQRAGVSERLVTYHLGTMVELRRKVVRAAIHQGCLWVIAQALAVKDPIAVSKCPPELKDKASATLV